MNKIRITVEYIEDDNVLAKSYGAFNSTDKTIPQISKMADVLLEKSMANIITEYLTK